MVIEYIDYGHYVDIGDEKIGILENSSNANYSFESVAYSITPYPKNETLVPECKLCQNTFSIGIDIGFWSMVVLEVIWVAACFKNPLKLESRAGYKEINGSV